jgi:hypothetical protein
LLLFPSGALRSTYDRALAWGIVSCAALGTVALALRPGRLVRHAIQNPFGISALDDLTEIVANAAGPLFALAFVATLVSMFYRLRIARGIERQQFKFFFLAAAVLTLDIVLGSIAAGMGVDTGAGNVVGVVLFILGFGGLAVAITVAILRYRLYDIDVLINRALVYTTTTGTVVLAYVGFVFAFQVVLDPVTKDSDLAVAASTLAVAGLARPLRSRLQSLIDRRFYRRKYDARRILETLGGRLRDQVEIESVADDVLAAVNDTVQPAHAAVWLTPGSAR